MRHLQFDALLRALLIGATGVMLLVKVFSGALPLYVHVRYTPLITGTGVTLLLLGALALVMALRGQEHHHAEGQSAWWRSPGMIALLIPVLLGLVVPSRALGSAALDTRGIGSSGVGIRSVESVAGVQALGIPDPARWTMLDWVNALTYQPDNPTLQGQPIELVGFVWKPEGSAPDHFVLSRFIISCCTADSLAIGMHTQWPATADLERDQWVRVSGTLGLTEIDGKPEAIILATDVTPVDQPAEPYIYP